MARTSDQGREPRRSRKSGGGGAWFFLALLLGAVVAGFYFMPQILTFIGAQDTPEELGDAPTRTAAGDVDTASREQQSLPPRGAGIDKSNLDQERRQQVTIDRPAQRDDTAAPSAAPVDDSRARDLLGKADAAYRDFEWDRARSLARQVESMRVSKELAVQADDLVRGADALEHVFASLGEDDELERNLETHPMLVVVTHRGREEHLLPVTDLRTKAIPETSDPVLWVRSRMREGDKIAFVNTKDVAFTIEPAEIIDVSQPDMEPILAQKQEEFEMRRRRLEEGALANDPLAWYEAAKFAYRNRLDAQVTRMLDRAIALDPTLATTIREDKARDIYFKMMQTMEAGNKAQAAGWKVQLDKFYQDTSIYDEAVAFYQGNIESLRLARREAAETRRRQREEALAARRERAEELGDQEQLAALDQQSANADSMAPTPDEGSAAPAPVSGDRATADELFSEGSDIMSRAMAMGVCDERDLLYAKAEKKFAGAMELYRKLGLEAEVAQANQYRYACIKYRRF